VPAGFAGLSAAANRETATAQHAAAKGEWAFAARKAQLAHRLSPWASAPLETLAQTQMADAQFDAATATLQRAISLDPRNRTLWLDLAIATDGWQHGIALDRARALDPLDPTLSTLTQR
jgi:Flp pilus assembly protein TadD